MVAGYYNRLECDCGTGETDIRDGMSRAEAGLISVSLPSFIPIGDLVLSVLQKNRATCVVFTVCAAEASAPKPNQMCTAALGTCPSLQGASSCLLTLSLKYHFVGNAAEQNECQYLSLYYVLAVISHLYSISGGKTPQWKSMSKSALKYFVLYAY